jgi:hypothetical protein
MHYLTDLEKNYRGAQVIRAIFLPFRFVEHSMFYHQPDANEHLVPAKFSGSRE